MDPLTLIIAAGIAAAGTALSQVFRLIDRELDRRLIRQTLKEKPERIDDVGRAISQMRRHPLELRMGKPSDESSRAEITTSSGQSRERLGIHDET